MATNTLFKEGLRVGFKLSFWSSVLYIPSLYILMLIISFFMPSATAESSASDNVAGMILGIGFCTFIVGVIPATIIGTVCGGLIGFILTLFGKRVPNTLASFIGFTVGVVFVLLGNYFFWRIIYANSLYSNVTFVEYLFPINNESFITYILFQNWYFLPSIVAILLSPFIGLMINKTIIQEAPK